MTKIINGTQRMSSYISASGARVYEREQYNAQTKHWYIVGDCHTNEVYIKDCIDLHNLRLQIKTPDQKLQLIKQLICGYHLNRAEIKETQAIIKGLQIEIKNRLKVTF
jgi:hypothetical protein